MEENGKKRKKVLENRIEWKKQNGNRINERDGNEEWERIQRKRRQK